MVGLSARERGKPSRRAVVNAAAAEPDCTAVPGAEIVYFTDPLCSWSWALEPQWRRLLFTFGDRLYWRYRMGGMIPDWTRSDERRVGKECVRTCRSRVSTYH